LGKNSWPRRVCRYFATPRPVTYAELMDQTKTGGLLYQGMVYHTLGLIDAGNPEIWLGLVKRSMRSEADKERMQQIASLIRADYVYALKFDEIVFNPNKLANAGNLTPIEWIIQNFGEDFPAPVSAEELFHHKAPADDVVGEDKTTNSPPNGG